MHIVPCGLAVSAERRARFRFNGKITSRRIQMKPNMPRKVVTISHLGPPSKVLIDVADELTGLPQYPVLDVGCGFGRNAVALAARGLSVVCVDQDLDRLQTLVRLAPTYIACEQAKAGAGQLYPLLAKLNRLQWPFAPKCFGAIICVHFLDVGLLDAIWASLVTGGRLYIETFGGHGGNYLDLPKAGQLRNLLSRHFNIAFYRERKVGPADSDAVSVKLLGKKL
jgi:SAM-dependent methyltransferase